MFGLEKEMAPIIAGNLKAISEVISTESDMALAFELPVKYRLIDIAIAYALPEDRHEIVECFKSLKHLNGILIDILSAICLHDKVTATRLKQELFMESDELNVYLNRLVKYNLIERISKFSYHPTGWGELVNLGIISIELKLHNWKEALEQAEYNLQFSDFSFVALDSSRILNSNEDLIPYFKEKNIGLLSVSPDGEIETLLVPKKNRKIDKRLYVAQRIKFLQDMLLNQKWRHMSKIQESF